MIARRRFLAALGGEVLAVPVVTFAQQQTAKKIPLVALLLTGSPSETKAMTTAFRQGLRDLGYVEGRSIAIEPRWADLPQRLSDIAADLVKNKVDIIVTQGTPAAQAVKRATNTIPIVMGTAGDPVAVGLVASLARPGGNVTGNSILNPDQAGKTLELLKEIVPSASRVAVLSNPTNPTHPLFLERANTAAKFFGVALQVLEVKGPDNFERAFQAAKEGRADALVIFSDPVLTAHRPRLASLALKNRLPSIYGLGGYAEAGGLIDYGVSLPEVFRRAATYVDRILKGAKPADIPVEQASRFELVVNMKTAKALGLTIPQSILVRADRVIE